MKKLISLLALLILASCNSINTWYNVGLNNTWSKIDDINVSSWNVNTTTKNEVSSTWKIVDTTNISSWETEEKDTVVVVDNNENESDLDWKTQEEVVDEMGDYVNDLFNMIEEDVK